MPAPAPQTAQRTVKEVHAFLGRGQGVGDGHSEVVVGVEADGDIHGFFHRGDHGLHFLWQQVPGGVRQVDIVGSGLHEDGGLLGQLLRADHMHHHEKADGEHAVLLGVLDVLDGDVGLGAVGGDANGVGAAVPRLLQALDGPDAREQKNRQFGVGHHFAGGADEIQLGVLGEPVVDGGACQTVTVADLDDVHPGCVKAAGNGLDLIGGKAVAYGVATVAHCRIDYLDYLVVHEMHLLYAAF